MKRSMILILAMACGAVPAGAVGLLEKSSSPTRVSTDAERSSVGFMETSTAAGLKQATFGLQPQPFQGLLDSDRFSIQHSVGMTYQSGYSSGMNQYYLGTIVYKAAEPLTIRARVGVANNLFGTPVGGAGASSTQLIVPDVSVMYQPKDNLRIEFRFSQQVGPGYYRGDFGY